MAELQPSEVLFIPKRKRLTHARLPGEDGTDVLHVFYGDTELVFDEPDIAPLGEKLIEVEQFRGEDAMTWTSSDWERVRDLLQALLDHKVLSRVSDAPPTKETYPQRLGEAPEGRQPATFSAADGRCPVVTEEAFGRAFDVSNLEVLVPIYRVAHPAMDVDGRQVGENNVMPRTLFLDLPTQRKLCSYPGSRYQHDLPMNVTAMKQMSKRWPELLSLTEQFRAAVVARMPPRGEGRTAGELHFIAVCMLASVGYVMVRGNDPVPNGQLDGGLAAMFRLVDGVRLVTNDLVRAQAGGKGCESPVTSKTITDYAERHGVYRGNHGVCAGPPALIDEYLRVLFGEDAAPIQVEPDVAARLGDLQAAIDYGLVGQRIESVVRFLGASEGLLHEQLRAVATGPLKEQADAPIDAAHYPLLRDDFALAETFSRELDLSRWLFARAGEALGDPASLDALVALDPAEQEASRRRLGELMPPEVASIAATAFALERRCLRLVEREQATLNARLQRPASRTLTNVDLAVFTRPRNGPPFAETLARGLGIFATSDAASTVIRVGDHSMTITE
ncbi:MAG TPA: hypothetical protein VGM88_29810 [Kofleriaceae bacterium]|jgi:hypothetical protein